LSCLQKNTYNTIYSVMLFTYVPLFNPIHNFLKFFTNTNFLFFIFNLLFDYSFQIACILLMYNFLATLVIWNLSFLIDSTISHVSMVIVSNYEQFMLVSMILKGLNRKFAFALKSWRTLCSWNCRGRCFHW